MSRYLNTPSQTNEQAALNLAAQGIPVFPVGPDKRPLVKGWPERATTDRAQIRRWFTKWPDAMPGIPTGPRSGLAVVDPDCKGGKDGLAELRAMGLDPDTMSPVIVATPTGGRHLYFRYAEGLRSTAGQIAPGVDTRAAGGYVVGPGAVSPKGIYRLVSGTLTDPLPEWPEALRAALRPPREPGEAKPTGLPFRVIESALMAVPNDDQPYTIYLDFGMAIHAETGGSEEGLAAWQSWCDLNPNNDPDLNAAKWQGFHAEGGLTGWTIIVAAEAQGWTDPAVAELRRLTDLDDLNGCWTPEELEELEILALVGDPADVPVAEEPEAETPKRDAARPVLLSPEDCLTGLTDTPDWIIKGLIERGIIGAIYGDPNAGKTNFMLYASYRVAQGEPAFGRKVNKVPVLYLAFEAPRGMKRRVGALRREHGPAEGFHLWPKPPNLKPDKKGRAPGMDQVIRQAKAVGAGLVVIDTLAAGFAGIEENAVSAEGMSAAVREMQRLANEADCAVIVLHHPRKGSDDMRGSGSLLGTLDLTVFVEKDATGDIVRATSRKTRDTAGGDLFAYRNKGVHLADDADGDPITTVICEEADPADVPQKTDRLPPSASAAFAIWNRLVGSGDSVSEDDWRDECTEGREVSQAEKPESRRDAFKRAARILLSAGLLAFRDGAYHRPAFSQHYHHDGSDFDEEDVE